MEIAIKAIPYVGLIISHLVIALAYVAHGKAGIAIAYFAASTCYMAIAANAFYG